MAPPRRLSGQLTSENLEWSLHLGGTSARFGEYITKENKQGVAVWFEQDKQGHVQSMWVDLNRLQKVVALAEKAEKELAFQREPNWDVPDKVENIRTVTASFFGRELSTGEKRVEIRLEQTVKVDFGRERTQGPLWCDLPRLREFAGEGIRYKEVLAQEKRWYHVVKLEGVNQDARLGDARVVRSFEKFEDAEVFALQMNSLTKERASHVVPWPLPQRSLREGQTVVVHKGVERLIDNQMELFKFDQRRETENYVLCRWGDVSKKPEVGHEATWNGIRANYQAEAQDYEACIAGNEDKMRHLEKDEYILLRKTGEITTPDNKKRLTGVVMDVSEDREKCEVRLQELQRRHQEIEKLISTEWQSQTFFPSRRF